MTAAVDDAAFGLRLFECRDAYRQVGTPEGAPVVEFVREWVSVVGPLVTAAAIIIPAVRRWLVKPLLDMMNTHAKQHEHMDSELRANGSEVMLPEGERNLPLRTLVIRSNVALRAHMVDVAEYRGVQERQHTSERADDIHDGRASSAHGGEGG